MRLSIFLFSLILFSTLCKINSAAQAVNILGGNTLNGAVNGVVLGGATMALANNSDDFYPLQVGLGLGTLYGIGAAAYDIATGKGRQVLVSGVFNDGNNSSIIVLMDTFYGAAGGALISLSISLISSDPILEGLQYGTAAGAYVGFAFGLFDSFVLAQRSTEPISFVQPTNNSANGLLTIDYQNGTSVGLISPSLTQTIHLSQTEFSSQSRLSLDVVNIRLNF
jgi:hypothetical protein